jgi:hypothetical protein
MKNGTFNTSKCRGKLQKMGVLYTHPPKSPGPFSILPKKKVKYKNKKLQKMGVPQTIKDCAAVGGRLRAPDRRLATLVHGPPFLYTMHFFFKSPPPGHFWSTLFHWF